jgi:hypothetical protein
MQHSAVVVGEDLDPGQYKMMMSNALRRVGVQVHDQQGALSFSTSEKQWPQIEQTLSVRDMDAKSSTFTPLKTFADPSVRTSCRQYCRAVPALRMGYTGAGCYWRSARKWPPSRRRPGN